MKGTVGMDRKPDEARAFLGLPPRRIAPREPHALHLSLRANTGNGVSPWRSSSGASATSAR